jgi:hypothetical protein
MLFLKKLGDSIRDIFDANTQADQQRRLAAGQPRYYNQQQNQLATQGRVNPINTFRREFGGAARETLTRPQSWQKGPRVSVGDWKGSGLVEDFFNSPFKIGEGAVNVGQGNIKQGIGQMGEGLIEGPLGLIPIGKTAQVAGKSAKLLPKVMATAKQGAKEGAIYGGAYGGSSAMADNQDWGNVVQNTALGAGMGFVGGSVLGGAIPVAGAGAKATLKAFQDYTTTPTGQPKMQAGFLGSPETPGRMGQEGIVGQPTPATLKADVAQSTPTPVDKKQQATLKKKAEALIKQTDAKATQQRRNTTVAEEVKIAKALEKAGIDPATVPARPKVTKKPPTGPVTTLDDPGLARQLVTSTSGLISRYGEPGQKVAKGLSTKRDLYQTGKAKTYQQLDKVLKLKDDQVAEMADALELLDLGGKPKLSPEVKAAMEQWQKVMPNLYKEATQGAKLKVGDRGPNYFPREYSDIGKQKGFNRLVQAVIDDSIAKGKPVTEQQAIARVQYMKDARTKKSGHLEMKRKHDLPGYDKTHQAIVNYIDEAQRRIAHAKVFGAKDEVIKDAEAQLHKMGVDVGLKSEFRKFLNVALELTDKNTRWHKGSRKLRSFQAITSLSAAGISNAGQTTNAMEVAGITNVLRGYKNKIKANPANAKLIADSGVAQDTSIKRLSEQNMGTSSRIGRNIASPGFAAVEKFNREATAVAGAEWADRLARKVVAGDQKAMQQIRDLGVTGKIGEKLTHSQRVEAARKLVERTQFLTDPMDMPPFADTPGGALVMQFRSFVYKQTAFMYNEILRKALDGDPAPMLRFLTVGAGAGMGTKLARDAVRGNFPGQDDGEEKQDTTAKQATDKYLGGVQQVGGFGLPGTAVQSVASGMKYDNVTGSVISTIGGPTVGLIQETKDNLQKAEDGYTKPLIKEAVRKIPAVGPTLNNTLLPSTAGPAKAPKEGEKPTPEYLDEQSDKQKEEIEKWRRDVDSTVLEKLPNGKYAYAVPGDTNIQTAKDFDTANKAITKELFKQSDQNQALVGNTYWYKNEEGEAKSMPKYLYEFNIADSQNQLDMYVAKENEDYGTWNKVASEQLKALETLKGKYQKDNREDKVDDTQKKIETLKVQMAKYAGYGGSFTKGSSGGRGGGSRATMRSPYDSAVSLNAGGSIAKPKVSVGSSGKTQGRKVSSSKPKVTIKKSKV